MSKQVSFQLKCDGNKHVDQGQTVTLDSSPEPNGVPSGGTLTATAATIGPIPATWPDDTTGPSNCPTNPAPTPLEDNGNTTVTFKAPTDATTGTPYTFSVTWRNTDVSIEPKDSSAITGSTPPVYFKVTVENDSTAPVINSTLNPADADGNNGWYKSNVGLTWSVTDPESAVTKTGCVDQNITTDQQATTYSCSATSAGGSAAQQSVTLKRDATPPTNIRFVGGPDASGTYAFGSVPAEPTCTADDATSTLESCVVTGYGNAVGNHTLTATATDKAGNKATATRTYTVNKANQVITGFDAIPDKTFGDANFTVSATGGASGEDVIFTATGNCKVVGNTVQITGAGSCTVTASQAGNANYNAATDVSRTFTIEKASQTITFDALANKTFGDPNFGLNATADSGLSASYSATGSCSIVGANNDQVSIDGAGSCTITASQTGNANYKPADPVSQSFTIDKATATIKVDGYTGTYDGNAHGATGTATGVGGANLNSLLDLGASFTNAPGGTANWSFAGNGNYNSANGSVAIVINKATANVQLSGLGPYIYDGTPKAATATTSNPAGLNVTVTYNGLTTAPTNVGSYNVVATVDNPNYQGQATGTLVIKPWTTGGFYQPVDMGNDVLNTVKNGSTVPIKFELFSGTTELTSTSAVSSVTAKTVSCTTFAGDTEDAIEMVTTGGTSLRYDSTGGQFIYNWQTPKKPNTCYNLTMTAADGSTITAYFKLK